MRLGLRDLENISTKFVGTIFDFSQISSGNSQETILIRQLKVNENIVTDHVWILKNNSISKLKIDRGDIVEFIAKPKKYVKENGIIDFKLSYISKFKIIGTDFSLNRVKNPDDAYWTAQRVKDSARKKFFKSIETGTDLFTKNDYQKNIKIAEKIVSDHKNGAFDRMMTPTYVVDKK